VVWLGWCGIRLQAEVGLSLFNYQDDARSNKHEINNPIFTMQVCLEETMGVWRIRLFGEHLRFGFTRNPVSRFLP